MVHDRVKLHVQPEAFSSCASRITSMAYLRFEDQLMRGLKISKEVKSDSWRLRAKKKKQTMYMNARNQAELRVLAFE